MKQVLTVILQNFSLFKAHSYVKSACMSKIPEGKGILYYGSDQITPLPLEMDLIDNSVNLCDTVYQFSDMIQHRRPCLAFL